MPPWGALDGFQYATTFFFNPGTEQRAAQGHSRRRRASIFSSVKGQLLLLQERYAFAPGYFLLELIQDIWRLDRSFIESKHSELFLYPVL